MAIARMALLVGLCAPVPGLAALYYIDPAASGQPDGSAANPWPSISAALKSGQITGGDEIRLQAGSYGEVILSGASFDTPVSFITDPDNPAHFEYLEVGRGRNMIFDGLEVFPEPGNPRKGPLIAINADFIELRNLDIKSRKEADGYMGWSQQDWLDNRRGGILIKGADAILRDSQLTAVAFAIGTTGPRAQVLKNHVRGFSGDAMRGLGDGSVFRGNTVQDCTKIDANHDDGFQSWSIGAGGKSGTGTVRDITIDANTILEWTGDPNHPLRCPLQGVGLFDGVYDGFVISNNVIVVSGFHGIAVGGGTNVTIVNNTLINSRGVSRKAPWITITEKYRGMPATGNVVANNIAALFQFSKGFEAQGGNIVVDNFVVTYPAREMVDPGNGNFRLKPTSDLVGKGLGKYAPATDRNGNPRPLGAGVDPGAYEVR